jgi:tetratricopeptide (TPR) repeat protein
MAVRVKVISRIALYCSRQFYSRPMQQSKSTRPAISAQTTIARASFFMLWAILLASGTLVRAQSVTQPSGDQAISPPAPIQEPLAIAEQFYRTGKLDAAIDKYNEILKSDPKSALAYAGLVRVYLRQKKPAEAYVAADKAVELAPTLDAVRVARAEAYFRQGKINEAGKEFNALVNARTKEPRAYLGLSRLYKAASYYQHSQLTIERAYELDPKDPDILRERIGYLTLAERVKALQAYLSADTNDDAEERQNLEHQLVALQDQTTQSRHSCRQATKITATETKLERFLRDVNTLREYGLRVGLNGTTSKLMLDTGAGGIFVDRKVAEKAGIKRVVQSDVKGIGDKGPAGGYLGYADSITVGELEFRDCYVRVIDRSSVVGDDGLIGGDFFSSFLVDIDFPGEKLKLSPLPPRPDEHPADATAAGSSPAPQGPRFHDRYIAPEMQSFSPLLRFGHTLLIPTSVNELAPKLFIIDTGMFANSISPAAAREVTRVWADTHSKIKGISGSVNEVFRASELTINFAQLRQTIHDVVAFDTTKISNSVGTEVSGFLGFAMLRLLEIKIDYRDGLVDFEFDPNRIH